jgi:hypothetical protein
VQFRDFRSTLPALAPYSLAALISVFGNRLWLWSLDAHLWWVTSLCIGAMVGRQLGMRSRLLVGAVALAASVSFPVAMGGHTYNYASTSAAGLSTFFVLRFHGSRRRGDAAAAGLFAGACVLLKINVGLVLSAASGIALLLSLWLRRVPPRAGLPDVAAFTAGWLLGFLPLLLFFAVQAGFEEVYLQMIREAATEKGGILQVIGRGLPRFAFGYTIQHRRLLEFGVSVLLIGSLFLLWNARFTSRRPAGPVDAQGGARVAALYFAVLVGLSISSLFALQEVQRFRAAAWNVDITEMPFQLAVQLMYVASMTFWLTLAIRPSSWRDPVLAIPLVFLPAISYGHAISSINQVASAAPLAMPLLFHLFERSGSYASSERAAWGLGAVALSLVFVFQAYAPTYERLVRMPAAPPFAGLVGMPYYRDLVETLVTHVAPRIEGRRTLWLVPGGPHCAYGGRPVPSVAILYVDTHSRRSEAILREEWSRNPPEYVVLGEFPAAPDAEFLTESGVREWLERDYTRVWEEPEPIKASLHGGLWSKPLSLWRKN